MRLAAPEWLLLLAALVVAGWVFRTLGLQRVLRALAVALAVLALAGPEISSRSAGLDLWVLVDRSESAAAAVAAGLSEWPALLEQGRGPRDEIHWVPFAAEARLADGPDAPFEGRTAATRLGLALRAVLAAADPGRAQRVVAFTDGRATDGIDALTPALVAAEIPFDLRLVTVPEVEDAWVRRFRIPEQVARGEPVMLEAEVAATRPGAVPFVLERDGAVIHRGEVMVDDRGGTVRLVDRPPRSGAHQYRFRIQPTQDGLPGNNQQVRWVEVTGGARILLVTSYPEGPLAKALAAARFDLEVVSEPSRLNAGRLAGARAVILEDVPAHRLPGPFLAALPFFVREQGRGLLMTGGRFAFGSGGYFESAIDTLLPVSMELRQEHRKLAVALGLVLDRSGSMSARVMGAGGFAVSKMDLANDGAARAVELLGPQDQITALAVDSEAHVVVPRVAVSSGQAEIISTVRRINSQGGGIYVYEGLAAAWAELKDAPVGQRHIILFSDAADSEEPGGYVALLDEMTEAGATVSVIGLGQRTDVDADLLVDIAERGKGRVFFTEQAAELPALFAQETVAVARSVFVTDPAGVAETAGWLELAPRPLTWPTIVDAYNLSYARPEATVAATTRDDQRAPLVAFWRRGRGRAAAVCFPLAGEGSSSARAWPGYGDFVQSLTRWLAGDGEPAGVGIFRRLEGSTLHLELRHDERWTASVGLQPPRVAITHGPGGAVHQPTWERVGPGRWQTQIQLEGDRYVRGAVQVADSTLTFGPVNAAAGLEWARDPTVIASVRRLVEATGGVERARLGDVWRAPRPPRYHPIAGWFWAVALVVFLLDALLTRTGHRMPELRWPVRRDRREVRAVARTLADPVVAAPDDEPEPEVEVPDDDDDDERRRRLMRAKRRR